MKEKIRRPRLQLLNSSVATGALKSILLDTIIIDNSSYVRVNTIAHEHYWRQDLYLFYHDSGVNIGWCSEKIQVIRAVDKRHITFRMQTDTRDAIDVETITNRISRVNGFIFNEDGAMIMVYGTGND